MSTITSQHSRQRIVQRTEGVNSIAEAKRIAKQAWTSGKTIGSFSGYPEFTAYLQNKRAQSRTCNIRVYRGNIYIWKGKQKTLVTAHPIPNHFLKELEGEF